MSRFVNPVPQFYLNNGDIASAGKLYFYETGTTTKKDTYSDFGISVKNTNPVILSGEGRCPNIFGEGRYTVVFKDSEDIEQWTRDDVELSVEVGQYADWSPILTYRVNDIVRGSDGEYYQSKINTNVGNDPTTNPDDWDAFAFLRIYNALTTYQQDDIVIFGGNLYRSRVNDNTGNQPDTSFTQWDSIPGNYREQVVELGGDFNAGQSVTCIRQGNTVTISSLSSLAHSSGSTANSGSAVIPVEFRPSGITSNTYFHDGASGIDAIGTITVFTGGNVSTTYSALSDGTNKLLSNTFNAVSITYNVED